MLRRTRRLKREGNASDPGSSISRPPSRIVACCYAASLISADLKLHSMLKSAAVVKGVFRFTRAMPINMLFLALSKLNIEMSREIRFELCGAVAKS
jgi:hypothetical protein